MLAIIPNFRRKAAPRIISGAMGWIFDTRALSNRLGQGKTDLGFRICGLRVQGFVIQVQGLGFKGSGSRVYRLLRSTALGFRGQCCHNSMSLVSQLCEPVDTAQSLVSTTPVSTQS